MNDEELDKVGRIMAGCLRHFPDKFGLKMNEYGWVDVRHFIAAVKVRNPQFHWLKLHHIQAIVETDPKGRYQFKEGLVRATYGHSCNVELDLPLDNIPDILFYPTTREGVDILLETGLKPTDRKKVHLSKTYEDAEIAGKLRVADPVILSVDAKSAIENGIVIQRAGTTVYLTNEVPAQFLKKAEG